MKTMYKQVLLSVALFAGAATTLPSKEAAKCLFENVTMMVKEPQALFTKTRKRRASGLKPVDLLAAATAVKAAMTFVRSEQNSPFKVLTSTLKASGGSLAAGILLTLAGDDFVPFCKHYGKTWFDAKADKASLEMTQLAPSKGSMKSFSSPSSSDVKSVKKSTDYSKYLPSKAGLAKGSLRTLAAICYLAGQNNWNPIASIQAGFKNGFWKTFNAFLDTEFTTEEKIHFVINTFVPLIYAIGDNEVSNYELNFKTPSAS